MSDLSIKRNIREIFDKIAESYAYTRLKPWSIVLKPINSETRIFGDMGCGPGQNIQFVLEKSRKIRVVGVDVSRRMLVIALKRLKKKKLYGRVDLVEADLEFLPFRNNVFYCLAYIASIHHLPSNEARFRAILEAKRILKPNGKILVTVWALFQRRFLKEILKKTILKILGKEKSIRDFYVPWKHKGRIYFRYYHLFTLRELKSLIRTSGLLLLEYGGFKIKSKLLAENYFVLGCKRK